MFGRDGRGFDHNGAGHRVAKQPVGPEEHGLAHRGVADDDEHDVGGAPNIGWSGDGPTPGVRLGERGGLLGGGSGGSGGGGSSGGGSSSSWSLGDIDLGDDAGAFIIVVIAVIVVAAAVFGIAFYAVYSAPTFFAELLIDGGVGTWLYKRANVKDDPDWLATAVRRTLWPAAAALVLFWAFGGLIEFMAPGATTVGQALRTTQQPR